MHYLAAFFTGAFFCNALPHLAAGLQGNAFPTPFAKPRGIGNSSALVNVLWGFCNVIAGAGLLTVHPMAVEWSLDFGVACLGGLFLGVYLARHFARQRR